MHLKLQNKFTFLNLELVNLKFIHYLVLNLNQKRKEKIKIANI